MQNFYPWTVTWKWSWSGRNIVFIFFAHFYKKKTNLVIVLLYIEQKKGKSFLLFRSESDTKHANMITRGFIKFLCRRSVRFYSRAFSVLLMKESKKRRRKQPGKSMAKSRCPALTTIFVDTRLWKTKHLRERFQNLRQSYLSLTDRIEIHQSQPLSVTFWPSLRHASGLWLVDFDPICW